MKKGRKKFTVVLATGLYSPEIGGPATYTKILEEELHKHNISLKIAPFRTVRWLPRVIRHVAYLFYLIFKSIGSDIIYALDPVSVGFPGALASRIANKRFLVRIAGDYAWEQGTQKYGINEPLDTFSETRNGYPFFLRFLKRIERFVAEDAERIIVPSNYLKKVVTNWGVSPDQITVIYNAFSAPDNLASKEVLRKLMSIDSEIIMSAGRLVPWKGFPALIKVMAKLKKKRPNIKLFIAGSGVEEKHLQKLIAKKKLEDTVVLVGSLDKQTLHNYIKAADVFVLNTFYEGLSHQLLECMHIGTPVVTTSVGGNPETIEHDKHGFLVDYNDEKALAAKILFLLENRKTIDKFVKNAKKKVKEFNREKMIKELLAIL